MNRLRSFFKRYLSGEWVKDLGPISVLYSQGTISLNLLTKSVKVEGPDGREYDVGPGYSYGLMLEPFACHLMGKDGCRVWSSPGWRMMHWVFQCDEQHLLNYCQVCRNPNRQEECPDFPYCQIGR